MTEPCSDCRITDADIPPIAKGLEQNRQLQELVMDNNKFSDTGAAQLVKAALQCETLNKLSIKVTLIEL